jgi:TonB family protein
MTAATKLTFGTYYTVELVRSTELSGPSSYRDAFAEEMKDLLSEKQGLVPRKKSAVREQPPIKRLDARGKTPQEVSRAIEALKNKTAHATQSVPTSGVAEGGNVSPEADALNAYYGVIWAEIKAKWAFPGGLASGRDLIAVVHVRVMKNGMAEDIVLQQRSANAVFNESVIKAVKKASPFPPFPAGLRESMMELGIRFHSSQLGTK